MAWQLQHAKSRFSEVVKAALEGGPQTVTRRGEETVAATWDVQSLGVNRDVS